MPKTQASAIGRPLVHTTLESPYSVVFARVIASSTSSKAMAETADPKIPSCMIRMESVTPPKTVACDETAWATCRAVRRERGTLGPADVDLPHDSLVLGG